MLTPEERQRIEQSFEAEFGVPPDEFIARVRNGGEIELPSPRVSWGRKVPTPLAADTHYLRLVSTTWGLRAYKAMFGALGFLALSKFRPTHWLGFAGAWAGAAMALWCIGLMWVYRRRARHTAST